MMFYLRDLLKVLAFFTVPPSPEKDQVSVGGLYHRYSAIPLSMTSGVVRILSDSVFKSVTGIRQPRNAS